MRTKAIIVEFFDSIEVVTVLPIDAPDPTQAELDALAHAYILEGGGSSDPDEGGGVATCRVVERIVMFAERPLTAAQQAAMSGLPSS